MSTAQILTPWTTVTVGIMGPANFPLAADRYPLASWVDVTGTAEVPPEPNLVVIEATCDAATLDLIDADPDFSILWSTDGA